MYNETKEPYIDICWSNLFNIMLSVVFADLYKYTYNKI